MIQNIIVQIKIRHITGNVIATLYVSNKMIIVMNKYAKNVSLILVVIAKYCEFDQG